MVLLLLIGFLAGVVTAISPCVLPVLPILLAGGASGGRRRPYAIIAGLVLSFVVFTLTAAWLIDRLGLPDRFLHRAALVLLFVVAAMLLVALGGRRISSRLRGPLVRPALGVVMALAGIAIVFNLETKAQTALGGYTNSIQGWFERTHYVDRRLNGGRSGPKLVSAATR